MAVSGIDNSSIIIFLVAELSVATFELGFSLIALVIGYSYGEDP